MKLSNHLNCHQVLFVTPGNFPQASELFPRVQLECSAEVEWWEAKDIFDRSLRERMGMPVELADEETKAKAYLREITETLSRLI